MKAVVVAKTRMGKNICVGAVACKGGQLLRLIPRDGAEYHSWHAFDAEVGAVIELTGEDAGDDSDPPHVEDYIVDRWQSDGSSIKSLGQWLRHNCEVWRGNRSTLFGGKLQFTSSGKGHLKRGLPLPSQSVGFWEIPAQLSRQPDGKHLRLVGSPSVTAPYVGLAPCPDKVPAGALVRVSLARWWQPDDGGFPEACWLQISGHYLA